MLVLSRKKNQAVLISGDIKITIVEVRGDKVRLGIDAPKDIAIFREEIADDSKKEEEEATTATH